MYIVYHVPYYSLIKLNSLFDTVKTKANECVINIKQIILELKNKLLAMISGLLQVKGLSSF